ncbi:PEPxxWA-CTERM sorting domain-containing protein [Sphingomonas abaci]|uniref:Ice-binding protein C-terminal domain-containing protein n=1 Tax=Sphingomonas abaci TaxID=237611 RepID=A0A7W7EXX9_9SPHN|nr:PEPxxWA-CTERM sorting domain-containing protein [Sphingomonas abaci]MBB4618092.1 hypothetical protein [Sphingomonas abaci]
MSVALAATLVIAAPAQAATIVDTGKPVGGDNPIALNPNQSLAGRFLLTSATVLTDIQGFIGSSPNAEITIAIRDGVAAPGNVLYSGSLTAVRTASFQGLSDLNWMLDAGQYWVSFASSGYSSMMPGAPRPMTQTAYLDPRWGWQSYPMSMGVRISGVAAAVPEPATWAMMIVGFGVAGGALRRRSSATRAAVHIA